jgi:transposase-like protein
MMMVTQILEKIHTYTERVRKGEVQCDLETCPICRKAPRAFKLHDRRERTFLVAVDRLVHKLASLLPRWKCPLCKTTFTLYPDFALPRKRYVRQSVFRFSQRYVDEDRTSYRKAAKEQGLPVFYDGESEETIDDRTLAHSTLHRWLTFFSSLEQTLREALRLIRAKSPGSGIFRKVLPIPPWKFQSEERKRALDTSKRLFTAEREYRAIFEISIFPRLATSCCWE